MAHQGNAYFNEGYKESYRSNFSHEGSQIGGLKKSATEYELESKDEEQTDYFRTRKPDEELYNTEKTFWQKQVYDTTSNKNTKTQTKSFSPQLDAFSPLPPLPLDIPTEEETTLSKNGEENDNHYFVNHNNNYFVPPNNTERAHFYLEDEKENSSPSFPISYPSSSSKESSRNNFFKSSNNEANQILSTKNNNNNNDFVQLGDPDNLFQERKISNTLKETKQEFNENKEKKEKSKKKINYIDSQNDSRFVKNPMQKIQYNYAVDSVSGDSSQSIILNLKKQLLFAQNQASQLKKDNNDLRQRAQRKQKDKSMGDLKQEILNHDVFHGEDNVLNLQNELYEAKGRINRLETNLFDAKNNKTSINRDGEMKALKQDNEKLRNLKTILIKESNSKLAENKKLKQTLSNIQNSENDLSDAKYEINRMKELLGEPNANFKQIQIIIYNLTRELKKLQSSSFSLNAQEEQHYHKKKEKELVYQNIFDLVNPESLPSSVPSTTLKPEPLCIGNTGNAYRVSKYNYSTNVSASGDRKEEDGQFCQKARKNKSSTSSTLTSNVNNKIDSSNHVSSIQAAAQPLSLLNSDLEIMLQETQKQQEKRNHHHQHAQKYTTNSSFSPPSSSLVNKKTLINNKGQEINVHNANFIESKPSSSSSFSAKNRFNIQINGKKLISREAIVPQKRKFNQNEISTDHKKFDHRSRITNGLHNKRKTTILANFKPVLANFKPVNTYDNTKIEESNNNPYYPATSYPSVNNPPSSLQPVRKKRKIICPEFLPVIPDLEDLSNNGSTANTNKKRKRGRPRKHNKSFYDVNSSKKSTRASSSPFGGVVWLHQVQKWKAYLYYNSRQIYCGTFDDEILAAQKVNEKCDEQGIPHKNPTIEHYAETSYLKRMCPYNGVFWDQNSLRWLAMVSGYQKTFHCGSFRSAYDAAKAVNEKCQHLGFPLENNNIPDIPPPKVRKGNISPYIGVSWKRRKKKWKASITHDGRVIHIGHYSNQFEAALSVNSKCDELDIPRKNLRIGSLEDRPQILKKSIMLRKKKKKTSKRNWD